MCGLALLFYILKNNNYVVCFGRDCFIYHGNDIKKDVDTGISICILG